MIRVVAADDQPLVRAGLRVILDGEAGIQLVGEAADGEEAIEVVSRLLPDVVLMDIRMPRLDGLQAISRLAGSAETSRCRILALTTFDVDEYAFEAIRAGASGFLLKEAPTEQLVAAIQLVAAGDSMVAPSAVRRLVEQHVHRTSLPSPDATGQLTGREREVLLLVAGGLSNSEIASQLHLSEGTVKTHVTHILGKLDLRDRVQAVVLAYETGLVPARPGPAI